MTYAPVSFTSSGVGVAISIPFGYLSPSHIKVAVNGAPYTGAIAFIASGAQLTLTPFPSIGALITVYRATPVDEPAHTFQGGVIVSMDLNANQNQVLFRVEELVNELTVALRSAPGDALDQLPSPSDRAAHLLEFTSPQGQPVAYRGVDQIRVDILNSIPGPVRYTVTKAQATVALPGYPEGTLVEVQVDESRQGRMVRYRVASGMLVYVATVGGSGAGSGQVLVEDYGWTGNGDLITALDIASHPEWIGTWVAGTLTTTPWGIGSMKDTVALQEAVWKAMFSRSTPGVLVANAGETSLNKTLRLPPGKCYIDRPIIMSGQGIQVLGYGTLVSSLVGLVAENADVVIMDSLSYTTFMGFSLQGMLTNTRSLVSADYTGTFVGLKTQQNRWIGVAFFGANLVLTGLEYNRVALGGGQGSETSYYGCNWSGLEIGLWIKGNNALSHTVIGGDMQGCTRNGVRVDGGSVNVLGTAMENQNLFSANPEINQFTTEGYDVTGQGQPGGNSYQSSMRNVRSESSRLFSSPYPAIIDGVTTFAADHGGVTRNYSIRQCFIAQAGTLGRSYVMVDDGSPFGWADVDPTSTVSVIIDNSRTMTVNAYAGMILENRYYNNFSTPRTIASNTAHSITLTAPLPFGPASKYRIQGLTAASEPAWDAESVRGKLHKGGDDDQGFTTTVGSAVVLVGSEVNNITVGMYVAVARAKRLQQTGADGRTSTTVYPLMGKVLSRNVGAGTVTLNQTADLAVLNAPGYFGPGIVDGGQVWMEYDFNAVATAGDVIATVAKGCVSGPTRARVQSGTDGAGGRPLTEVIRNMQNNTLELALDNNPGLYARPSATTNALDLATLFADLNVSQLTTVTISGDVVFSCSAVPRKGTMRVLEVVNPTGSSAATSVSTGVSSFANQPINANSRRLYTFISNGLSMLLAFVGSNLT